MANTRKPKRPAREAAPAKATAARKTARPARKRELDTLTPERLRTLWALEHPDRPEVRSSLERLYRRKY